MERPLIAIVGDAAKSKNPELAKRAAEEIGMQLANKESRILVYSSSQEFVEWEAVQGYLKSTARKEPASIEVRYPPALHGRFPGEKPNDPLFLRTQQGGDWEASIYPSFAILDGLILIGGGYTTKIAGLLAMGSKTPVMALSGLGGAAYEIWAYLQADRTSSVTPDDLNLMITPEWSETSAERLVDALLNQIKRKLEYQRQAALSESERRRRHVLSILALLGSSLFALVLLAFVALLAGPPPKLSPGFCFLLFCIPALAGASGAAVRVLWDNWEQRAVPLDLRPITMTIALGFWASGVVSALFIIEQLWLLGVLDAEHGTKVFGTAVAIGLLAGLTLDKVFPKLIRYDVQIATPLSEKRKSSRG